MPRSLLRDPARLTATPFDLLVIGGGIYGLTVAADAAMRGLQVAVVEQQDFGSGTSFNHLRTIHGGLRYLQTLDLRRARESVRERRTLARIAPWAVRPLPFLLPLQRSLTKGRTALTAGFLLDRVVAADRNAGLPPSHVLPPGRVLSRAEAVAVCPELLAVEMTAAARWFDYVTVEADRLTLAWAQQAADHGAALANYVEATALTVARGAVSGALAVDRLTGATLAITAAAVVNATGGHLDRLLRPLGAETGTPLLQAVNVVTRVPAPVAAIGGRSRAGRNLFAVPWQGRTIFGTWESPALCAPGDTAVREDHLLAFLADLNEAFPARTLRREDVTLVHRGVVPARMAHGAPTLDGRELVFDHAAQGPSGLISVAGTKYTTARAVAERIVDRVAARTGRTAAACRTHEHPLPHVPLQGDDLLRHAAHHEMVETLSDAVVRRTQLGALGCPDDATLLRAADIVGGVKGWSAERRGQEVARVRAMY